MGASRQTRELAPLSSQLPSAHAEVVARSIDARLRVNGFGGALAVAIGFVVQGVVLAWLFTSDRVAVVLLAVALALAAGVAWSRGLLHPTARMAVVVAALGGLGMLAGSWLDAASMTSPSAAGNGNSAPATSTTLSTASCHASSASGTGAGVSHSHELDAMLFSWMFLLMLVACVAGCTWLCADCWQSRRAKLLEHMGCHVGMVFGMMLGGDRALALPSGQSDVVSMHVAMVLGMSAGAVVGDTTVRVMRQWWYHRQRLEG